MGDQGVLQKAGAAASTLSAQWPRLSRAVVAPLVPATALYFGDMYGPAGTFWQSPEFKTSLQWMLVTILAVSLPTIGKTGQKSVERCLGSLLGGCLALVFTATGVAWGKWLGLLFAVVIGECITITFKREYTGKLVPLTFLIVAGPGWDQTHPWLPAVERMAAVLAGIVWSFLVAVLWFPETSTQQALMQLNKMMQGVVDMGNQTWDLMQQHMPQEQRGKQQKRQGQQQQQEEGGQHLQEQQQQQQQEQQQQQQQGGQKQQQPQLAASDTAAGLATPAQAAAPVQAAAAAADVCLFVHNAGQQSPPLSPLPAQQQGQHKQQRVHWAEEPAVQQQQPQQQEKLQTQHTAQPNEQQQQQEQQAVAHEDVDTFDDTVLSFYEARAALKDALTASQLEQSLSGAAACCCGPSLLPCFSSSKQQQEPSRGCCWGSSCCQSGTDGSSGPGGAAPAGAQQQGHRRSCGVAAYLPRKHVRGVAAALRHCMYALWMLHKLLMLHGFSGRAGYEIQKRYPPGMMAGIQAEAASILQHAAACLSTAGKHQKQRCLIWFSSSSKNRSVRSVGVVQELRNSLQQQQQHLARLEQHLVTWRKTFFALHDIRNMVMKKVASSPAIAHTLHLQPSAASAVTAPSNSSAASEPGECSAAAGEQAAASAAGGVSMEQQFGESTAAAVAAAAAAIGLRMTPRVLWVDPDSKTSYLFVLQWHALHYLLQQLEVALAELTSGLQQLLQELYGPMQCSHTE